MGNAPAGIWVLAGAWWVVDWDLGWEDGVL